MAGAVSNQWKRVEDEVANLLGGVRRGASFVHEKNDGTHVIVGNTDVIKESYAIEVKHTKRPTWGLITGALKQAAENKTNDADMPVAVIHRERDKYTDCLVVLNIEDFKKLLDRIP